MSDHQNLEQAKRRMVRYRILMILDAGRPIPVGEGLINETLSDADLGASPKDIRKALQYLCDKKFIDIQKMPGHWDARLLPVGVDYLENPNIQEIGIARPASF